MWQKLLAREGVDLTTISGINSVYYELIDEFAKTKSELFFTLLEGKNFTHFIGIDPHGLGRNLYKKLFNSPEQIKRYYENGKVLLREIKKSAARWKRLSRTSDKKELLKAYKDFRRQFETINHIYSIYSWLSIEAWQNDFEKLLSSLIKKNKLEDKKEKIIRSVYKPWKNTAVYEIQEKIKKGVDIEKLVKEYQFLRSWCVVWYRPIDKAWVRNIGKTEEKPEKLLSIKQIIALLKPNKKEKRFLALAPYMVFFKDWRDDLRRMHAYSWSFFFELLASRFDIDYRNIGYLTLNELEDCLKKDAIDKKEIESRKNNPCIITLGGSNIKVIWSKIPKRYYDIIKQIEEKEKQLSIKGFTAQKGKAKGKVIVVKSYHDIKKVKKGHILVANTTHPNYLPAMQKAAAFITNEGGIASHAAIVSREMKKPCIVGTKIATKVLKTGDLVEVDAEKGIIKKIKSISS